MTIVVDANLAAAVAIPMDYTDLATHWLRNWKRIHERLAAPMLFEYEISTALRRSIVLKILEDSEAILALDIVLDLGIELVAPTRELDERALYFAERVGQSKAYDGHYLALAARENAPLWTADRRLASAAQQAGLPWVHWIGEAVAS